MRVVSAFKQLLRIVEVSLIRTERYLLTGIVVVSLAVIIEFMPMFLASVFLAEGTADDILSSRLSSVLATVLSNASSVPEARTVIIMLVWAAAGLLAYFLGEFVLRMFRDVRNEIRVDVANADGSIGRTLILRFSKKLSVLLVCILFLVVSCVYLVPYWFDLMFIFAGAITLSNSGFFIAGYFGLICNTYVAMTAAVLVLRYEEAV